MKAQQSEAQTKADENDQQSASVQEDFDKLNIQGSQQSGTQKNGEDGADGNAGEPSVGSGEGQVDESCIEESPQ